MPLRYGLDCHMDDVPGIVRVLPIELLRHADEKTEKSAQVETVQIMMLLRPASDSGSILAKIRKNRALLVG